jgi:hypothetical protein
LPLAFFNIHGQEIDMKSSRIVGKATTKPARTAAHKSESDPTVEEWMSRVATAAYYKAESRGFEPGHELEDWVAAEMEAESCGPHSMHTKGGKVQRQVTM